MGIYLCLYINHGLDKLLLVKRKLHVFRAASVGEKKMNVFGVIE